MSIKILEKLTRTKKRILR